MTKSLMISIQPQHAVNVLNGNATLDLRTWIPKDYVGWVYVYVTKGVKDVLHKYKDKYYTHHYLTFIYPVEALNSKVVFRFWFDEYEEVLTQHHIDGEQIERVIKQACIEHEDLDKYVGDKETIYAWHIKKLEIFDEPKSLSEFYKRIDGLDEDGGFMLSSLKDGETVTIPELKKKYLLSKAPQRSVWVYERK